MCRFHLIGKTDFTTLRLDNTLVSSAPIYYKNATPVEMVNSDVFIAKTMACLFVGLQLHLLPNQSYYLIGLKRRKRAHCTHHHIDNRVT